MKLANRVSVVTGGGGAIGKAICLAFAREGSDVLIADIVLQKAEEVSKEIRAMGRKSLSFGVDVSNRKQVKELVKTALDAFGRIDVLANVAGIVIGDSPIEDLPEEAWDKVIGVNLKGTFLCSQAVGKEMIKQGRGNIINIASISGETPQIYAGAYSPSKAGIILLTKVMAVEWVKYNIRVNAISPGRIRTPLTDSFYNTEALRSARARSVPMNRLGEPEEIASGAVFLASNDSSYMTGESLVIDGGYLNGLFHLSSLLSA